MHYHNKHGIKLNNTCYHRIRMLKLFQYHKKNQHRKTQSLHTGVLSRKCQQYCTYEVNSITNLSQSQQLHNEIVTSVISHICGIYVSHISHYTQCTHRHRPFITGKIP